MCHGRSIACLSGLARDCAKKSSWNNLPLKTTRPPSVVRTSETKAYRATAAGILKTENFEREEMKVQILIIIRRRIRKKRHSSVASSEFLLAQSLNFFIPIFLFFFLDFGLCC